MDGGQTKRRETGAPKRCYQMSSPTAWPGGPPSTTPPGAPIAGLTRLTRVGGDVQVGRHGGSERQTGCDRQAWACACSPCQCRRPAGAASAALMVVAWWQSRWPGVARVQATTPTRARWREDSGGASEALGWLRLKAHPAGDLPAVRWGHVMRQHWTASQAVGWLKAWGSWFGTGRRSR